MFHEDGTFNFHTELTDLAETFCREWVERNGPFKNRLESALVLNFALCTIKHDLEQLLEHEAHVHAATMHNGKRQANLRLLSLGAPRTTRTQEGIAVLAELMTLSLDIIRLRRIPAHQGDRDGARWRRLHRGVQAFS